ncbi:MAG TPA: hypothetical protein VF250_13150 [Conexibacter sp.]
MLSRVRDAIRRWPLGSVVLCSLVIAAAAAVAAALIAVSGPHRDIAGLKAESVALERQLADVTDDYDATSSELLEVQDRLTRAQKKLALDSYKQRRLDLASQLADLDSRIRAQEAKLVSVKAEVAKSSFGDGTWEANVDFIPGTYQAPGGKTCYWAKLNGPSGNGFDNIIDNGGFNNRPVVSVDSPYFETSNCGTWRRVG